jgi:hypothetical protein
LTGRRLAFTLLRIAVYGGGISLERFEMRTQLPSVFLATALVCSLFAAPAQAAGAARTFLSAAGSDSNNCINVLTPCRHLATAYAATAADGEIYVLDPANYGSLTITHGVSIEGHGWASIAPVANGNAITINANPGDKINIIGVVLDGTALANTNGILFNSGGSLTVADSVVRNFSLDGIRVPPTSGTLMLLLTDVVVSDNSGLGIRISPSGTASVAGLIKRATLGGNLFGGIVADGSLATTSNIDVTIVDSAAVGAPTGGPSSLSSNGIGFQAISASGAANTTMYLKNVTANNFATGVHADNEAIVRITRSAFTRNEFGVNDAGIVSPGAIYTFGDNDIGGNQFDVGGALTPVSPQ